MATISYSPKAQRARELRAMRRLAQINGTARPMTDTDWIVLAIFGVSMVAVVAAIIFA